jgi:elongation factor 1 alpha-like protein
MGRLLCDLNQIPKSIYNELNRKKEKNMEAEFDYAFVAKNTGEKKYFRDCDPLDYSCFETTRYMVNFADDNKFHPLSKAMKLVGDADAILIVWDASLDYVVGNSLIPWDVKAYLDIAKILGGKKLLFAITKMDTIEWSGTKFDEIKALIERCVSHFGLGKNDLSITPVSGLTGENLVEDSYLLELRSWYYGPSLVEQINKLRMNELSKDMPLMLAFTGGCLDSPKPNTVKIYAVVESGDVSVGEEVIVEPGRKRGGIVG